MLLPNETIRLRALIVEDSADDVALVLRELRQCGYEPAAERVDTAAAMRAALKDKPWDIILSDYMIPGFGGMEALAIAKESGLDLPFVIVSGKASEETLVEVMKAGAADFLVKGRLGRIGLVVKRELADAAARRGIRQAQIEWRTAFDSVRDPIFFHDAEFRIVRANLAYAALARMPIQEVIGKRYWEVFPKRDGPLPGCAAHAEAREGWKAEEFTLPGGEAYSSRSFPVANERGEYLYSFHVLQDVTERNRVLDAMETSEHRFRALIENASDLVCVIDARGSLLYVSPSIERIGGYASQEVLGRNIMDFTHPDDLQAAGAALHAVTTNPRDTYAAEIRFRRKDGSFVVLDSIARNMLDDPTLAGIVINARDITERKQAQAALEQRQRYFRKLIEGGADAFFVIDRVGTVTYRSPTGKKLTGWNDADVMGKSITNYVVPESLPAARNAIAETVQNPDRTTRVELRLLRKDGAALDAEATARNLLADPDVEGIVVTVRDISERKSAEERIRALARFPDENPNAVLRIDAGGTVIYANPASTLVLEHFSVRVGGQVQEPLLGHVRDSLATRSAHTVEATQGGRALSLTFHPLVQSGYVNVYGVDITERKRAEAGTRKERDRAQSYLDIAGVMMLALDLDGRVTLINKKGCEILGYAVEEVLGKHWIDVFLPKRDKPVLQKAFDRLVANLNTAYYENIVVCKDGREKMIAWYNTVLHDESGNVAGTLSSGEDITERKHAEEALRASRDLLGSVVENTPIRVFWKDAKLRYLGCNNLFARDAGKSRAEDVVGKDDFQMGWRPQAELYRADDQLVIDSDTPKIGIEEPQTTPDGRTIWLRTSKVPLHDAGGKAIGVLGIYDDVTERKQAEDELKRLNWAMRALSQSNSALVHAVTDQELFRSCCEAIASSDAYPLAWIGLARDDPARTVEPVTAAGKATPYLEGLSISWGETPLGRGPTGTAIRSGATQVVSDIVASVAYEPWLEKAQATGLASSISLPILSDGRVIGALMVYGRDTNAFGQAEVKLFEELAGDIGYGLATHRTRVAYEASVVEQAEASRKLSATFESAIEALAVTVEQRDPYTAGHQRRVALLATAIGRELGLDESRLAGLRIAATIHDIGKIAVPAEILSRPGRLSPVEFEIVKSHAQSGYDIVKGVDFPWPVADAIRQHHERLDGSGYPQGLKGDQIIPEARILAVADVVEAMSSHRPYRPGLGIDSALKEIENKRGRWFDAATVDACLRLFREKGFVFESR